MLCRSIYLIASAIVTISNKGDIPISMRRKLHFGEFEVVKFKRKHCGAELPPNQVLVKLRKPGARPIWNCLDWHEFCRKRSYRECASL
jgi:hypothetical protein